MDNTKSLTKGILERSNQLPMNRSWDEIGSKISSHYLNSNMDEGEEIEIEIRGSSNGWEP